MTKFCTKKKLPQKNGTASYAYQQKCQSNMIYELLLQKQPWKRWSKVQNQLFCRRRPPRRPPRKELIGRCIFHALISFQMVPSLSQIFSKWSNCFLRYFGYFPNGLIILLDILNSIRLVPSLSQIFWVISKRPLIISDILDICQMVPSLSQIF